MFSGTKKAKAYKLPHAAQESDAEIILFFTPFVSKAPAKLVEAEKEKLAKYQDMKAKCVAQLESL